MKNLAVFLLISICALPCLSAYIGGAKISNGRGIGGLLIEGEILPGDFAKFEKVVLQRGQNVDPVWLASPGGDLGEAIKIGRLIRELKLTVWAPDRQMILYPALSTPRNAVCASACFFMYAAGIERRGEVIGIHRPYFATATYQGMGLDESASKQARATHEGVAYLREMGVTGSLIEKMLGVSPDQIVWLSSDEVKGLSGYVPGYAEWFQARCPLVTTSIEPTQATKDRLKQLDCRSALLEKEQGLARFRWNIRALQK